jgi:DNA-binding winged helix-turn-helix (wHTH) protein
MESSIDAPRVAIVQERPVDEGWVEFVERLFRTTRVAPAAEGAEPGTGVAFVAATDFVVLQGRSSWVEAWIRDVLGGDAGGGLMVVLRHWSARAAAQILWQAADDVVGPCVEGPELCARIHAILRRGRMARVGAGDATFGMRRAERRLLDYLRASQGRIVTQSEILNNVFGGDRASGTSLVRVHVSRLRRRLGAAGALRTVRGAGYVLDVDESTSGRRPAQGRAASS